MQNGSAAAPQLRRLTLRNIGPFHELELELDRGWNVLLGDNGVGKSNILRAIAAGLLGAGAEPHAERLLKVGASAGEITLETSVGTYLSTFRRVSQGVSLATTTPAPVPTLENWLALGFPPLRTAGWRPPGGPQKASPQPDLEDLLPLLTGEPDRRIERLKRWLINLDYEALREEARGERTHRWAHIRARFFEMIARFTPEVRFHSIRPETHDVLVQTEDGIVPMESISQGSGSLLSWIGLVLQRLYELYADDPDPTIRYALILIDEIDAHLHPAWQQTLVPHLRTVFPNAQFVATTHSPLIVTTLARDHLRLLRREEGHRVVIEIPSADIQGLGADQILTSALFQLRDTRSPEMMQRIDEYAALLGVTQRTIEEQARLLELEKQLGERLSDPDTAVQRTVEQAIRETILRQRQAAGEPTPREVSPDIALEIKRRVKQLFPNR